MPELWVAQADVAMEWDPKWFWYLALELEFLEVLNMLIRCLNLREG